MKHMIQRHIKQIFISLMLLLTAWSASAISYTGGDLSYKRVREGIYEFTLTLEKNCNENGADFEDRVTVGIYNMRNEILGDCGETGKIFMKLQSVEKKKNNLESTCIDVEDEACREVAVYKATAFLAISTYGYQFVYSDCCRSGDIQNFLNPENEGFTLISTLSLNGFLSNTDSPVFDNDMPLYSCLGEDNMIHLNPRPERNEEYRFELCRPLTGKPPHNQDLPPSAPPYDPIDYAEGYSFMDPLGEDGELSIHPTTGVITYTGDKRGSYMVAVCIHQYKAGQLVGSVMREIEVNFAECSSTAMKAEFDYTVDFCNPGRVMFENKSVDATAFEWRFYTDENTSTTSTKDHPVMTFTSPGTYLVELATEDENNCVDTARKVIEVYDFAEDIEVINVGSCADLTQELSLNKEVRNYDIRWYLVKGDGETEIGSGADILYTFPEEGFYDIRVEAEYEDCIVDATRTIQVVQGVTPLQDTIVLCEPGMVSLNPNFSPRYHYEWNIDSLIDDKNDPNPMVHVSASTLFPVTITEVDDADCTGEGFVLVLVDESPVARFDAVQDLCSESFRTSFTPVEKDLIRTEWTFNVGGELITSSDYSPEIDFPAPGYYEVSLSSESEAGCTDQHTRMIEIIDPETDLSILNFGNCQNYEQVLKLNKPIEGYDLKWSIREGESWTEIGEGSQIAYDFGEEGNYVVRVEVSNPECTIVIEDVLVVTLDITVPQDTIDLCMPGILTLNPVSYEGYTYEWLDADLIDDVTNPSPEVFVSQTTRFEVQVTDKDDPDCTGRGFVWVRINEAAVADFTAIYDICEVDKTMKFAPVQKDLVRTTWIFDKNDPSATSEEYEPSFTYEEFGEYEVTLIAETAQGCVDTNTQVVVVDDLFAILDFEVSGKCEGLDYSFELNNPAIGYDVTWYLDDAGSLTQIGEGIAFDHTFDRTGKHDIRVALSDDECERSFVRTVNIIDGIAAPDTTIYLCEPGLIALNPFGIDGMKYEWSPAGLLDDPAHYNPVATVTESTDFHVSVEVQDGDTTCQATGTVRVIIDEISSVEFDTTTVTICEGDWITLNEGGDSAYEYYWEPESFFEDARISSPETQLFTSQRFTVTMTNPEQGCSVSFQKQVNVKQMEDSIDIDYAFVCGETKATLIAHDIPEESDIEWFYGDSLISTETIFEHDFGTFGTFDVRATLVGECVESYASVTLFDPDGFHFQDTIYLCEPETVQLNPDGDTSLIYTWVGPNLSETDVPSPTAEVEGNSIYLASIRHPQDTTCQTTGRVYVFLDEDSDIISVDKTDYCMGDTVELRVGNGGDPMNIEWTGPDGEILGSERVLRFPFEKAGKYSVKADIRGCTFRDTVELRFRNVELTASQRDGICPGDEISLQVNFGSEEPYDSIVWLPEGVQVSGEDPRQATFAPDSNTVVTAMVYFSDGCLSMDTIQVNIPDALAELTITADRDTLLRGEKATLTASNSTLSSYSWEPAEYVDNPSSYETEVIPEQTTTFTLTAIDENGCEVQKTITIVVLSTECEPPYIFVPRAFSPNGDGVNDVLYVRGESIDEVQLIVYDRWGEKVFETRNKDVGWDGTHHGKELPPDVYGYYLNVTCIGGETYEEKGNVTIIR